jgi:hypothetical protein
MLHVYDSSPDCRVTFYPFTSDNTSNANINNWFATRTVDAGPDLMQATTHKAKGAPGGFEITLGSHVDWKTILQPGCWCTIHIAPHELPDKLTPAPNGGLKMVGIVQSVRRIENTSGSNGTRTVRYQVSGEDFQFALMTPLYLNSNLSVTIGNNSGAGIFVLLNVMAQLQTPATMVRSLINILLGTPNYQVAGMTKGEIETINAGLAGQPFKVPPSLAIALTGKPAPQDFLTGFITLFLQENLLGNIQLQSDIGQMSSVWSLCQAYSHPILNEFYSELLPVNVNGQVRLLPSVVLRAIPFSMNPNRINESCILLQDAQLPTVATRQGNSIQVFHKNAKANMPPPGFATNYYVSAQIPDSAILNFNFGRSDRERFNFFFVPANIPGVEGLGEVTMLDKLLSVNGLAGIMDLGSVQRYGLRPFVRYSNYLVSGATDISPIVNDIVKDMWQHAHLFDSGQVTFAGTEYAIPVGTNIYFLDRNWAAHVEAISHTYVKNGGDGKAHFSSTATFVRLYKPGLNGVPHPVDVVHQTSQGPVSGQMGRWDRGVSQ